MGTSFETSVKANPADPRKPIRLSAQAETWLVAAAASLQAGETELWQLPPGIYEFWLHGWGTGYSVRTPEVSRLNSECDRLYRAAFNPRLAEPASFTTFEKLEQLRDQMYGGVK